MTVSLQFITMLMMMCSGIYLGLARDTHRRLLVKMRKNNILFFILEISFWVVQAVVLFYVLFLVNSGELRFYIFLACLLGFSAYQALLKNSYLFILEKLIKLAVLIFRFFYRLLELIIWKPLKGLVIVVVAILTFLLRVVLFPLLFIWKIVSPPLNFVGNKIKTMIPKKSIGFFHKIKGIYSTMKQKTKK